jgi:hypothetical protein
MSPYVWRWINTWLLWTGKWAMEWTLSRPTPHCICLRTYVFSAVPLTLTAVRLSQATRITARRSPPSSLRNEVTYWRRGLPSVYLRATFSTQRRICVFDQEM